MLKRPEIKAILTAGLSGALVSLLLLIVLYFFGYDPYGKMSLVGIWIPVIIIVFGIKYIKDNYYGYEIGFAEGLVFGLAIGFVFSAGAAFANVLFHIGGGSNALTLHTNELVQLLTESKKIYLETMKMPEKEYLQLIENNKKITISDIAIDDFIKKFIGCILVALISAVIMRRHIPKPENVIK